MRSRLKVLTSCSTSGLAPNPFICSRHEWPSYGLRGRFGSSLVTKRDSSCHRVSLILGEVTIGS